MAISAGDFRTGLTLIVDGDPWVVLDFQHVKPGKGAAILKTKMKNLKTGSTQERNFNASTKFEQANIQKKAAQYSYEADSIYYFMDMETYDTYELSEDQIGFNKYFLVEGEEASLVFFEGMLLSVSHLLTVEGLHCSLKELYLPRSCALQDLRWNPAILLYYYNQTCKRNRPLSDCLSPSVCSVFPGTYQYPYGMYQLP